MKNQGRLKVLADLLLWQDAVYYTSDSIETTDFSISINVSCWRGESCCVLCPSDWF